MLEGTGYSVASFQYAFFRLSKSYPCEAFAVLTKANSRGHSYASFQQFSGELHRVALAVNPDVEGCFRLFTFIADFAERFHEHISALLQGLVVILYELWGFIARIG